MKLEPLKQKNLPKYAAALAVAASAVLLTGCHPAGDVLISESQIVSPDITEQVIPDESSEDDLRLDGETELCPDPDDEFESEIDAEIIEDDCSGCKQFEPPLETGGNDDGEPLMLEGDVAWIPDYQEATDDVQTQLTDDRLQVYMDAFADAGLPMARITEGFSHYGTKFTAVMANRECGMAVAFFDGTAEDQDTNMFDYLTKNCACGYDWGCVLKNINFKDEYSAMIFIDISKEPENAAAFAAQIAKDVT